MCDVRASVQALQWCVALLSACCCLGLTSCVIQHFICWFRVADHQVAQHGHNMATLPAVSCCLQVKDLCCAAYSYLPEETSGFLSSVLQLLLQCLILLAEHNAALLRDVRQQQKICVPFQCHSCAEFLFKCAQCLM